MTRRVVGDSIHRTGRDRGKGLTGLGTPFPKDKSPPGILLKELTKHAPIETRNVHKSTTQ
jgi:hypothetical protein